jgi:alpha-mannosidase
MNLSAHETPYYYPEGGALLQAAVVEIDGLASESRVRIVAESAGQSRTTVHEWSPANRRITVLLPEKAKKVSVQAEAGRLRAQAALSAGSFRPWTIYVAQDKHLDYGWKHNLEDVMTRIYSLTDYCIDAHTSCGMRFNLDSTLWLEEYLRSRSASRAQALIELLRSGAFQMGALTSVMYNGILNEEELIHAMIVARRFERTYGIRANTVMPNEAPSMPWGMASVLAGSGVRYVVRGAYDLNNRNIRNRDPFPLFWWEGPDGSRVLTKFDLYEDTRSFGGYAEAWPLRIGSREDRVRFIERAVGRYESYASYPFDAILLAGTGWDEYPFTTAVTDFIAWYDSQGWVYPRLVDATWQDYFDHIEKEPSKLASLPVLRGDFGSAWEEWPSQLAYSNALFRNARRLAMQARAVSVMAAVATGRADPAREQRLHECFTNLCRFADHNIGGIDPEHACNARDLKLQWTCNAEKLAHESLEASMSEISDQISCGEGCYLVFNTLSWDRGGTVEIPLMEELGAPGQHRVVDTATDNEIPSQLETRGVQPEHYLTALVEDVPAFGCKVIRVEKCSEISGRQPLMAGGAMVLENGRFRLSIHPMTGGIASLLDKTSGRELADRKSPYALNQYLFTFESTQHSLQGVTVLARASGAVSSSITVEGRTQDSLVRTTYTIYESLGCVDIDNYVEKQPSWQLQTCHFVFAFAVPDRQYHYDGMAAILRPGESSRGEGDQLAGAAMGTYCGLHFADASNDAFGVTLCCRDTHLYHFGANTMGLTEGYIEAGNATIYSVAMENYNRNDSCPSQGNQDIFRFRYRVVPHEGPFDPCRELKVGMDAFYGFCWFAMRGAKKTPRDDRRISFVTVHGDDIIACGVKNAEEGGVILRLHNLRPRPAEVSVSANAAGTWRARLVDHLERDGAELPATRAAFRLQVPASGLMSVNLARTGAAGVDR